MEAVLDQWARKRSILHVFGGKVPFVFRTLPGYTFYAENQAEWATEGGPHSVDRQYP